jgi:AraC-like DNA-binding protein/mannose-6-phosphate isomerase-like protein (cupin superfamily)
MSYALVRYENNTIWKICGRNGDKTYGSEESAELEIIQSEGPKLRKYKHQFEKNHLVSISEWTPSTMVETFHWHTSLEIGYCISGHGWFYFGDKTFEVRAGDIFVVNNMERHIAQSDAKDPSKYVFVYFDPLIIEQENIELLLPFVYNPKQFQNQIPAHLPVAQKIGLLIQTLQEEYKERNIIYRSMMRSVLLQICGLLLRHYSRSTPREDINRTLNLYHKLDPALTYMKEHFQETIELEDIASRLNLSPSRTRHLFKETIGEGFKEYLIHLRVNEAKRLLSNTDLPTMEICMLCGFQSHSPFYRAFNKIVEMTPQDYRKQASVASLY